MIMIIIIIIIIIINFGSCTRKTLDRFTTKDGYTWNSHIIRKVLQCEA